MAFRTSEKQPEGPHVKEEVLINSKFKYKLIFFKLLGDCRSQPCENGGTCVELGDTTICQCSSGFTGSICQGSECVNLFHPVLEE